MNQSRNLIKELNKITFKSVDFIFFPHINKNLSWNIKIEKIEKGVSHMV